MRPIDIGILIVVAILLLLALRSAIRHYTGKGGGCCGCSGGSCGSCGSDGNAGARGEDLSKKAVTAAGQRYEIPTNIRIVTKYWNKDVQRSVGRTPADKEANLIIERTAQDVEETIRKIHQKGFELTMENFRMNYQAQENQYSTLTALFEYHRIIKGKSLSDSTNWQYERTLKHLLNFVRIRYKVGDYAIEAINKPFVQEFFAYLQGFMREDEKKRCNQNGALKHMQRFSKVMKLAFDNEWVSRNPVKGLGCCASWRGRTWARRKTRWKSDFLRKKK